MKNGEVVTHVTKGNVFKDLGFDHDEAVNLKIRSDLMISLDQWVRSNGYTQEKAAQLLGIGRSEVSNLRRGKVDLFSIDKLVLLCQKIGKTLKVVDVA